MPRARRHAGDPRQLHDRRSDLNGDGRDDFVTDLANLQCADAWSAFCGPSGCPVSAWLSEPDGGFARFDFGHLDGFEHPRTRRALPRSSPATTATYCGDDAASAPIPAPGPGVFDSNAPEEPPIDAATGGGARPRRRADAGARRGARVETRLDASAGCPARARSRSAGAPATIASLAGFCLAGRPFLAVTFHERPTADTVTLGFAFSQGALEAGPASSRPRAAPTSSPSPTASSPAASAAATPRSPSPSTARPRAAFARRLDQGAPRRAGGLSGRTDAGRQPTALRRPPEMRPYSRGVMPVCALNCLLKLANEL